MTTFAVAPHSSELSPSRYSCPARSRGQPSMIDREAALSKFLRMLSDQSNVRDSPWMTTRHRTHSHSPHNRSVRPHHDIKPIRGSGPVAAAQLQARDNAKGSTRLYNCKYKFTTTWLVLGGRRRPQWRWLHSLTALRQAMSSCTE